MRVLIVVPWGEALGGAESMLLTLLRHARASGPRYEVAFLQPGPFSERVTALGVRTHITDAGRLRQAHAYARTVAWLKRLIDREGFDVVLSWSTKVHLYASVAARLADSNPVSVWWQHGVAGGGWLDRLATAAPASWVGCSSFAAQRAQEELRPRRQTFVVHPGVDVSSSCHGPRVRSRLGLAGNGMVLGMVGRIEANKGQVEFLEAVALLRAGGTDVQALLVGGDAYDLHPNYLSAVKAAVERLGLSGHCVLAGHVPDAAPYIQAMDVMVSASAAEGFGIVLVEAMALGVPVVAVRSGGPTEIVRDGVNGLLAESSRPALLAGAIRKLIDDPVLRRRLAAEGRRTYEQCFTGPQMASRLGAKLIEALEVSQ